MTKNYPSHTLFEITEADSEGVLLEKPDFAPIGVAFTNKDGSLNVLIDTGKNFDATKRHQLRKRKAKGGAA